MQIKHLAAGDHFQFQRQGNPYIHVVVDPAAGTYRTAGKFHGGNPRQLCPVPACDLHEHPTEKSCPAEKAVKRVRWESYPDAVAWSEDAAAVHDNLLVLEHMDREIARINAQVSVGR